MDTFTLAATSFIIAFSLMLTGKKDKLHGSFAALCTTVFILQIAVFLRPIFASDFWLTVEYMGSLAIAPFALRFFRHLTRNKSFISRGVVFIFTLISLSGVFSLFTMLSELPYFKAIILSYTFSTLALCYIALLRHVSRLPPSTEKKRLGYLLVACPIAVIVSSIDLFSYLGFNFPADNRSCSISPALSNFINHCLSAAP